MFIIAVVGLIMLAVGGIWSVIGFLLLPGAIAFFYYTIRRELILILDVGEGQLFPVQTTARLNEMVSAINSTIRNKKLARDNALRAELGSLPDAK